MDKKLKRGGILAVFGGALASLLAPLLSVGYYESYAIPAEAPPFWFSNVRPFFSGLFSLAEPKDVYTTLGKLFAFVYLLFLPGVFALHSTQAKANSRFEKYSFYFLVFTLIVSFIGVSFDYSEIRHGFMLELLGMLFLQIAATLYGAASFRLKIIPRWHAALFLASIPLCVLSFLLLKQIPSAPTLPFAVASIAVGAFILRRFGEEKDSQIPAFAGLTSEPEKQISN